MVDVLGVSNFEICCIFWCFGKVRSIWIIWWQQSYLFYMTWMNQWQFDGLVRDVWQWHVVSQICTVTGYNITIYTTCCINQKEHQQNTAFWSLLIWIHLRKCYLWKTPQKKHLPGSAITWSGQILIFHQPGFPWNFRGFLLQFTTIWGVFRSCFRSQKFHQT